MVALITGASSGIGWEIAKYFADKGWDLALLARRKARLDVLAKELATNCLTVECDLADLAAIDQATEKVLQWRPQVNALINNAGIYSPSSFAEGDERLWAQQFSVNFFGPVYLTRKLWGQFLGQKGGSIVNISSTLGIRPIANTAAYSASKAAMNNWTLSLALEGGAFGIRANALCPGLVDTPIHSFHSSAEPAHLKAKEAAQKLQPLQRIGQPQDIAPLVYHLASDESAWTTGAIINVDGGILLNS